MKRKILNRRREGKKVIRELECGHTQEQGIGGKVELALTAMCKACDSSVSTVRAVPTSSVKSACRICRVKLGSGDLCDPCWLSGAAHKQPYSEAHQ